MVDFGLPGARVALTIAGSDPSGGAGLQADLKTFHQFGVYGMAVPTLLTVQNTCGIESVHPIDPRLVRAQLECVQSDIQPSVAKSGALGTADVVKAVAEWARNTGTPLVVDPVILGSHGQTLASNAALEALTRELLPVCELVTPNLFEAEAISNLAVSDFPGMRRAAECIADLGARNVLVTGGHLEGDPVDLLWSDGKVTSFSAERVEASSTHGTGCTYSAAITALLARGRPIKAAIAGAKRFITEAIRTAPRLGYGQGPLNHHATSG